MLPLTGLDRVSALDLPGPGDAPRSRDIPCNLVSHLLVRQGKLEWLQVMRSNDLIWGTPYNFIQFTTLQEIMAGWLGLDVGTYNHVSDSLHVYERHWQELETLGADGDEGNLPLPQNRADLRIGSYEAWERVWRRLVDDTCALEQEAQESTLLGIADHAGDLPPAYAEWLALLTAEALRRHGFLASALAMGVRAGPFWEASWRRWVDTVAPGPAAG